MRRIISITAALMLAGSSVFATPAVTNKDASQNIINISGDAKSGDLVSVLIVNTGYTADDVADGIRIKSDSLEAELIDFSFSYDYARSLNIMDMMNLLNSQCQKNWQNQCS